MDMERPQNQVLSFGNLVFFKDDLQLSSGWAVAGIEYCCHWLTTCYFSIQHAVNHNVTLKIL